MLGPVTIKAVAKGIANAAIITQTGPTTALLRVEAFDPPTAPAPTSDHTFALTNCQASPDGLHMKAETSVFWWTKYIAVDLNPVGMTATITVTGSGPGDTVTMDKLDAADFAAVKSFVSGAGYPHI